MDAENVVHGHKGYNSAIKMTPCRFSSLDELESPEESKESQVENWLPLQNIHLTRQRCLCDLCLTTYRPVVFA